MLKPARMPKSRVLPARILFGSSWLGLAAFILGPIISCAPPIRDPFGLALRQGQVPPPSAPESLTVDLGISLQRKGMAPFSARLYAKPYLQYRLDAFGFSSEVAASYLWSEDHWTLLLNDRREVWEGAGDSLNMEGMGLHLPSVNALFGFLWGDPLPGFRSRDAGTLIWSGDTLRWKFQGVPWEARFDSVRGTCLEAESPSLTLRYRQYRRYGNRILPREVEASIPGEPQLLMKVNRLEDLPLWKKDPFVLKVPKEYERGSPEFPPDDGGVPENGSQ